MFSRGHHVLPDFEGAAGGDDRDPDDARSRNEIVDSRFCTTSEHNNESIW